MIGTFPMFPLSSYYVLFLYTSLLDWPRYETSIEYYGGDLRGKNETVPSVDVCAGECEEDPDCDYWSYGGDSKTCNQYAFAALRKSDDRSGKRICY